ncbi:MAG: hypothetical protein M3322_11670 [Actinomycetota bacterium]|nr:hypothetical protein [Actinomycetota bacterium]
MEVREAPRRPNELLYDAVACGMWLYTRAAFRVIVLGAPNVRLRPRLLLVSSHRSDSDVPLICSTVFFGDRMWRRHHLRLHFAARDDLFVRGVLAGLAPDLSLPLRRLLFRVDPSPYLPRVRVNPIGSTTAVKAVQVLGLFPPSTPLDQALPTPEVEHFRAHAESSALPAPVTVGDALRAEFAGLLWRDLDRGDLADPRYRPLWQLRARVSAADVRRVIAMLRDGEPLLLFPEGRPSPDGGLGPLRPGLGLLVRRGRPNLLLPFALAYDSLTRGRTLAYVSVGQPIPAPADDVEEVVLAELRRATPLTCGQVVSHVLLRAADADSGAVSAGGVERELRAAAGRARAERRPLDPMLAGRDSRRRRLSHCLATLVRLGLLSTRDGRRLELDGHRIRSEPEILRLAREYESAREGVADQPAGERGD